MAKSKTLTHEQVAALAESVGLPGETFAQLAKGESSYRVDAVGHDPGGTQGLGLWQITTKYNDDIIRKFGGRKKLLSDPVANAMAAKAIYDRQGIGAWYGNQFVTGNNLHYKGPAYSGGGNGPSASSGATATTPTVQTTPGVSHQAERAAAVMAWLQGRKMGRGNEALLQLAAIPRDTPAQTTLGATSVPSKGRSRAKAGKQSSQGMSKLLELFWEGQGAIDYSKGTMLKDGAIGGHSDHVHVAAGPKTAIRLGELAQKMGLRVGENPHFDKVDPVHTKNSYHYRNQAIDVSGDTELMRKYAAKVAHMYGLKVN